MKLYNKCACCGCWRYGKLWKKLFYCYTHFRERERVEGG